MFNHLPIAQAQLAEIEEEKLLDTQKRYDLSLKLRLEKSVPPPSASVNIIKVSSSINDWNLEPPVKASELDVMPVNKSTRRFTTNRAGLKLQAAQVNFYFYYLYFKFV